MIKGFFINQTNNNYRFYHKKEKFNIFILFFRLSPSRNPLTLPKCSKMLRYMGSNHLKLKNHSFICHKIEKSLFIWFT